MRLLTAGSLVRVQLEAPPGEGLEPNALQVFYYNRNKWPVLDFNKSEL